MKALGSRLSVTALALAACTFATTAQAVVAITTTPLPVVNAPGLTGFVTTGADMSGLSVAVAFNGGALLPAQSWVTTGPAAGGVTTASWSLTLDGDSFSTPWQFSFLNPKPVCS